MYLFKNAFGGFFLLFAAVPRHFMPHRLFRYIAILVIVIEV